MQKPKLDGRQRVIIEGISPEVDAGRFAAKRTIGDMVRIEADIFTDGHDSIAAVLRYRYEDSETWIEIAMRPLVNDRWFAEFPVSQLGRYLYTVHGWVDHFLTWHRDLLKRIQADSDTPVDYMIGADLIDAAAARASKADAEWLSARAARLRSGDDPLQKRALAVDSALLDAMNRYPDRRFASELGRELALVVDPVRARFSSWYELFPRSTSPEAGRHGTLADCEARLPYIAAMGFNVVYLPPIHPIGVTFRKGKNNSTIAEGDVGSPWAIGAAEGGHKSDSFRSRNV